MKDKIKAAIVAAKGGKGLSVKEVKEVLNQKGLRETKSDGKRYVIGNKKSGTGTFDLDSLTLENLETAAAKCDTYVINAEQDMLLLIQSYTQIEQSRAGLILNFKDELKVGDELIIF